MPEYITARCGYEIGPGDRYLEFEGVRYCGCIDCMDEFFDKYSTVHEYDPEGDLADFEYDSSREMAMQDEYEEKRKFFLDIYREEGEEG